MPTPALERACETYVKIAACNKRVVEHLIGLGFTHVTGLQMLVGDSNMYYFDMVPLYTRDETGFRYVLDEIRHIMDDQLTAAKQAVIGRRKTITKEDEPAISERSRSIGNYTVSTGFDKAILENRPGKIVPAIWHGVFD